MKNSNSNYCLAHNCGKCCERFILKVTEKDIDKWKGAHPEILNEVKNEVINGTMEQILRKRPVTDPDGTIRNVCVFYDTKKHCLIYDVRPENCQKFSCTNHIFFIFQLFNEVIRLIP